MCELILAAEGRKSRHAKPAIAIYYSYCDVTTHLTGWTGFELNESKGLARIKLFGLYLPQPRDLRKPPDIRGLIGLSPQCYSRCFDRRVDSRIEE